MRLSADTKVSGRRAIALYQPKIRIPGESRDPLLNRSAAGLVDPGFRRECGFLGTMFNAPERAVFARAIRHGMTLYDPQRTNLRHSRESGNPGAKDSSVRPGPPLSRGRRQASPRR